MVDYCRIAVARLASNLKYNDKAARQQKLYLRQAIKSEMKRSQIEEHCANAAAERVAKKKPAIDAARQARTGKARKK